MEEGVEVGTVVPSCEVGVGLNFCREKLRRNRFEPAIAASGSWSSAHALAAGRPRSRAPRPPIVLERALQGEFNGKMRPSAWARSSDALQLLKDAQRGKSRSLDGLGMTNFFVGATGEEGPDVNSTFGAPGH